MFIEYPCPSHGHHVHLDRILLIPFSRSLMFRLPVHINVLSYDENSCTEGTYRNVDEIPTVSSATEEPSMMCK